MYIGYVAVTLTAIAANIFPGVTGLIHVGPILPAMTRAGMPELWLSMIGALKTTGSAGLLLGPVGLPLIGTLTVIGFFVVVIGAISARIRVRAYSPQLSLAFGCLLLAFATLVFTLFV